MRRCWCELNLLLLVLLLLAVLRHARRSEAATDGGGCWSKNDCIIRATLYEGDGGGDNDDGGGGGGGQPIEINCAPGGVSVTQRAAIERSHVLQLDGVECYTIQDSYGFEYIPNCDEVVRVTVRRFNSDTLQPFQCPEALRSGTGVGGDLRLEVIVFTGNDINAITAESLSDGHYGHLRELHFRGNNLRHVYQHAFDALRSVQVLALEQEPHLAIKDARLVAQLNVATLRLERLKSLPAELFQHLPATLKQLSVRDVPVLGRRVELGGGDGAAHAMDSVALVNGGVEAFALSAADGWQVRTINLSGNALTELRLDNVTGLELLDLSANALTHLPIEWLRPLAELRHLLLNGNRLAAVSLRLVIAAVPTLLALDLRDNRLTALPDESVEFGFEQMPRVRIDRNPWDCVALQTFAQTHPEKFRFFQYDKFISQINVNGLACNPVESAAVALGDAEWVVATATAATTIAPSPPAPSTTASVVVSRHKGVTYHEMDHRSQRTEALIIVFMLPLGIAVLFVILYMWIYCEKIFHLSYYRCALPPFKRRAPASAPKASERRADIVRQIPPGTAAALGGCDGYELPLNGISSCNCHGLGAQKCQKRQHLTYVTLPAERPYLIYEEIVENTNAPSSQQEPGYDHLTFVGPIDASTL